MTASSLGLVARVRVVIHGSPGSDAHTALLAMESMLSSAPQEQADGSAGTLAWAAALTVQATVKVDSLPFVCRRPRR